LDASFMHLFASCIWLTILACCWLKNFCLMAYALGVDLERDVVVAEALVVSAETAWARSRLSRHVRAAIR